MWDCNDLFSRFEQQILFLEKQAEATDSTMDRHGHDGPSQGIVSKHLENLKLGIENRLSELRDGMAGRTIRGVTDRHRPLVEIWVSEFCDDLQDGPSQARRPVTGCANPRQNRISGYVLRDVFDCSCLNYKVRGFILITQILGVKRGNPKLISGVLLPSFILNYILIRVKERGLE